MSLLDTYGDKTIGPAKRKYQELYGEFSKVEKELRTCRKPARKHIKCWICIVSSWRKSRLPG